MFDPDLRINTPNSFPAYFFNTARQFVRMLIGALGRVAFGAQLGIYLRQHCRALFWIARRVIQLLDLTPAFGGYGIGILYRFRCTAPREKAYTSAVGPGATS